MCEILGVDKITGNGVKDQKSCRSSLLIERDGMGWRFTGFPLNPFVVRIPDFLRRRMHRNSDSSVIARFIYGIETGL
jgi:hypothetical protein